MGWSFRLLALAATALAAALPLDAASAEGDAAIDPAYSCDRAAEAAEAQFGIPAGLLSAIGRVESSRWRPELRRSVTWPFAIDSSGYDIFPESAEEAVAQVRTLQAQGIQSLDVGCFQINLFYHPEAFATLEDGFDPALNASYAARFLISLRERTGTWHEAVAAYHSGDPAIGYPYRDRVMATWQGGGADFTDTPAASPGRTYASAGIGAAFTPSRSFIAITRNAAILRVRIEIPSAPAATPAALAAHGLAGGIAALPRRSAATSASVYSPSLQVVSLGGSHSRLPRVITPN